MSQDWMRDPRLLPDLEYVQDHIASAANYAKQTFTRMTSQHLRYFPVESPIEAAFYAWWIALIYTGEISGQRFVLTQQHAIDVADRIYRLDFAVRGTFSILERAAGLCVAAPLMGIELDGHDFHERTREQVALRNERDRTLLSAGWDILYFSGSELEAEPIRCVRNVYYHATAAYDRMEQAMCELEVSRQTTEDDNRLSGASS